MRISINNPSSAGASLTKNTIDTLKIVYRYCEENNSTVFELKSILQDNGINWKNARTIFPLMRYLGFVDYKRYTDINTDSFFTSRGIAYMNTILLESEKDCPGYILEHLKQLRFSLVKGGLTSLLSNKSCRYQWILKKTLEYLKVYSRINKSEYAYLVYAENKSIELQSEMFKDTINKYRNQQLNFEVVVTVRNDQDNNSTIIEKDISYLTSYTYIISILSQADIIKVDNNNYYSLKVTSEDINIILKGEYDEQSR